MPTAVSRPFFATVFSLKPFVPGTLSDIPCLEIRVTF